MRSKLLRMTFLSFFILGAVFAQAQEVNVTGIVLDENAQPMPGVNIVAKQSNQGTATDFYGNFTLRVEKGETLEFSFLGYATQSIVVANQSKWNVSMVPDAEALNEVVLVGYGSQSKKNITSSVVKVKTEDLMQVSIASVDGALQGNANGLVVTQNSGAPGGGMSVRIRGATTVNGSNQPLYIVDDIPIITGNTASATYGGQGGNALTNLSPSDIESIEVLKDAAATAIYGARASNGVVLITTKRGKVGKPTIQFGSYIGMQTAINKFETMYTGEYYKWADQAIANGRPDLGTSYWSWANEKVDSPNLTENDGQLSTFYNFRESETYVDQIYEDNVPIWENTLSITGGSERTKYYFGGSFFSQDGVVIGQKYERMNGRLNVDHKAYDWLNISAGASLSDETVARITGDNNIYAPTTTSVLEQPGWNIFNSDGTYNLQDFRFSNPVQNATDVDGESETFRLLANIGLDFRLMKGLNLKTKWSMDRLDVKERRYFPSNTSQGAGTDGSAFFNSDTYSRWMTTNTLNYNKRLSENVGMNVLLGMEYQHLTSIFNYSEANGFASTDLRWSADGAEVIGGASSTTENKLYSYFLRGDFDFYDRYLLQVSVRGDASSKFGEGNQMGWFPSFSAGWKIQNEEWFDIDWWSELKLRGGWGQTGNSSGIGNFASRDLAGAASYAALPGLANSNLGDRNLSWETTSQFNIGVDLGFWNDRLTISYEYFNKNTTDLLLARPLPESSGWSSITQNVGEMLNRGHEVELGARLIDTQFKWDLSFSIATLENEVTRLYRAPGSDAAAPIDYGFAGRVDEGQPIGAFFVYQSDGLDENGDVKYVDRNGNGTIDEADKYYAGNPLPAFTGIIKTNMAYKGFDLNVMFQYSQDYEIYNNSLAFAGASGSFAFNKFRSQLDYWTTSNTDTDLPRPMFGGQQALNNLDSDRFIEDGSFVRLKNVTLGYNFPKRWIKNLGVRLYVGADNLFTITDYSGLDPEVNTFGATNVSAGTDFFTQGLNRTYKFGFNLTF